MPAFESRLDLYEHLAANKGAILEEARKIGAGLGVPAELKGKLGTTGANSGLPGALRSDIIQAIERDALQVRPLKHLGDDIRRTVKSVYGDGYDAAPTNSCEAAIWIAFDALLTPPLMGRGEPYRARAIGMIERHAEHHLSYGRPFPPKYKDLFADRGATAGELGLAGRRNEHMDIVMVPMAGASYALHGIKFYPCALLMNTDVDKTTAALRRAAEIHVQDLSGFVSLGYDTPGFGCGKKTRDGAPQLLANIGELAAEFGVPYVCDNAWGTPFLGTDPRHVRADVMLYSMDKVAGAPTSGLLIGKEEAMVNVRRALGIHGDRFGGTSAHGKASHVASDPGRMTMVGLLQALRVLRDQPQIVTKPVDTTHALVLDEYARVKGDLGDGIVITKSYNVGVEVNYEGTWSNGRIGIPIFNNEDRVAGSSLVNLCTVEMGVLPGQADDANVIINPGLGTVDKDGALIEERMRLAIRATFASLALLRRWAERGR